MKTSSAARITQLTQQGLWGERCLHDLLAERVTQSAHQEALVDQPNREQLTGDAPFRLSFGDIDTASDNLALAWLNFGLTAGDRILVQLPNIAELVVCYYAASKMGVVLSPIPMQYGAHEIAHLATSLDIKLALSLTKFKDEDPSEAFAKAQLRSPVWILGDDFKMDLTVAATAKSILAEHRSQTGVDANSVLTICWTSGTTGTPKGVPRSHNMWITTGSITAFNAENQPGERVLNPFPLVNMAGLGGFLFPSALKGLSLHLHHPIDLPIFLGQIQQEKINYTIAPPALLNKFAAEPAMWGQFDFSELRAVGSGSAPLSPAMIEQFETVYGKEIHNMFGSNEGTCLAATPHTSADPVTRATCFPYCGDHSDNWPDYPWNQVNTKVIDQETGVTLTDIGAQGEFCISGPSVIDGYWDHDNQNVFTEDGYFRTGDLVEICGEKAQYLRIAGRCKDIINRGGMKLSPAELDILLEGMPGLAEVAVCGYADEALGEKVAVVAVAQDPDNPPTLENITEFLRERGIAVFKLPEYLLLTTALPRNPLGKVLRHELSALVEAQRSH